MTFPPPDDDDRKPKSAPSSWPPFHDYWMYDTDGGYIYQYDYHMGDHPDAEFLEGTDYEDKWTKQHFWTVDQATALSFGRSPDKVTWDTYTESMYGSSEFATHLGNLRDRIVEALRDGSLPQAIPARAFAVWAEKNQLPFPPYLAEQVASLPDDVSTPIADPSAALVVPEIPRSDHQPSQAAKAASVERKASARRERNMRGVLYGLAWKHHRLGGLSKAAVAENIRGVITLLEADSEKFDIEASQQTIADWLSEAINEFGPPKKYE